MTGFVLWFTGLSGSGKSTLAALVATELRRAGVHVETLDGDEIRKNLSKGLGFSKEDRDANVRRLGFVARLIARSGGCAITAAISPYRDIRNEVRAGIDRFCEVHCDCPISVLAKRDPKGLYDKAMRGEIKNFTGIDDPYEPPLAPEVRINTDGTEDPRVSARRIIERLSELGYIGSATVAQADGLLPLYGHELQVRMRSSVVDAPIARVALDADAEHALVGLATGLLSPLDGFMGQREAIKVAREHHLERGLPWPSPLVLEAPEATSPGVFALKSPADGVLGIIEGRELWRDAARTLLGGEVTVAALPRWASSCRSVESVRSELAGKGPTVGLPLFALPTLGDEYLARAALDLGEHVVLMPILVPSLGELLVAACEVVRRTYLGSARVSIAPVPAPPTAQGPELLRIYAHNLGIEKILLPDSARPSARLSSSGEPQPRIHYYAPPYFDDGAGSFVARRFDGRAPSADALRCAQALRPEVAALTYTSA